MGSTNYASLYIISYLFFLVMKDNEIVKAPIEKGCTLKLQCGGVQEILDEARTSWFKNNKTLWPEELPTTLLSKT